MNSRIKHLIRELTLRRGASQSSINAMATELEIELPDDYVEFLLHFNGGEGPIGNSYISLWSIEDIPSLNKAYAVEEFAPGLVIIGSDGGGTAYAIDKRTGKIVEVPFISMDTKLVYTIGTRLEDLLEYTTQNSH